VRTLLTTIAALMLFVCGAQTPALRSRAGRCHPQGLQVSRRRNLPELKIHSGPMARRGKTGRRRPQRRAGMHGTGGTGGQFVAPTFAGELFGGRCGRDEVFRDHADDIGHGQSSKPSDGLRAKFPRYGYLDMVEAEYRLVSEGLGVNICAW
jgi:homoserine O-acetyltransferase